MGGFNIDENTQSLLQAAYLNLKHGGKVVKSGIIELKGKKISFQYDSTTAFWLRRSLDPYELDVVNKCDGKSIDYYVDTKNLSEWQTLLTAVAKCQGKVRIDKAVIEKRDEVLKKWEHLLAPMQPLNGYQKLIHLQTVETLLCRNSFTMNHGDVQHSFTAGQHYPIQVLTQVKDYQSKENYNSATGEVQQVEKRYEAVHYMVGDCSFQDNSETAMNLLLSNFEIPDAPWIKQLSPNKWQYLESVYEKHYHQTFHLFPYQREAVLSLLTKTERGKMRGILAYDTGLGKSRTSLAAAVMGGYKRVLIVALPQLVFNWVDECRSVGIEPTVITFDHVSDIEKLYADKNLKGFFIISYNTLKTEVPKSKQYQSIHKRLHDSAPKQPEVQHQLLDDGNFSLFAAEDTPKSKSLFKRKTNEYKPKTHHVIDKTGQFGLF